AAMQAFADAREVIGDEDPELAESAWSELINAGWWYPEHVPRAEAELARAVELARRALAPQRIDVLGTRGLHLATYTLTMSGYPDESVAVYDRVIRAAYASGDNVLASSSTLFRAYTHLRRGELAAVDSDLFRFSELLAY